MSGEVAAVTTTAQGAAMIAALVESDDALAVHVSLEELRALKERIGGVVSAAEEAMADLARLSGGEPGPMAAHLRTMLNMGAGYFRHCDATIEAAWRKRNSMPAGGGGNGLSGAGEEIVEVPESGSQFLLPGPGTAGTSQRTDAKCSALRWRNAKCLGSGGERWE